MKVPSARACRSRLGLPAALMLCQLGALVQPAWAQRPWTIPALREWTDAQGSWSFGPGTRIVVDADSSSELSTTASTFCDDLSALTGSTVPIVIGSSPQAGDIFLTLGAADPAIGEEGYLLAVADHITISARTDAGVFYGTRTVLQILRQRFEIPAGTARDWPDYPERGLMLVLQQRDYSIAFLQRHIKDLAYLKLNCLHLHLSDDAGFGMESSSHPEINSASPEYYSKTEIADLIERASAYHVMIVPEIDVPSHSAAILWAHPELALSKDFEGRLDLSNPATYTLVADLLNEYLPLFPGPFWHTGTDEYLYESDYMSFPQLMAYARQLYGPAANGQDVYIGFANWVDSIVKAHGKQLRAWNDVYGVEGITQSPNPDIVLEMWWPYILPQDALARGHSIINTESFTLYYVLGAGANDPANPVNLYENWAPYKQWVSGVSAGGVPSFIDLPASTPGILGGKLEVWGDPPIWETEDQVQAGIAPDLRAVSQNTWGSPRLTPAFNAFVDIMDATGHTPDWGPDFALMASSTSASAQAGQTAALPLQVAAISGFNQPVALICAPVTARTTCSVSPALVTPVAGASAPMVTLSIETAPGAAASPGPAGQPAASRIHSVLVTASAGSLTHTMSMSVTVGAPQPVRPGPLVLLR